MDGPGAVGESRQTGTTVPESSTHRLAWQTALAFAFWSWRHHVTPPDATEFESRPVEWSRDPGRVTQSQCEEALRGGHPMRCRPYDAAAWLMRLLTLVAALAPQLACSGPGPRTATQPADSKDPAASQNAKAPATGSLQGSTLIPRPVTACTIREQPGPLADSEFPKVDTTLPAAIREEQEVEISDETGRKHVLRTARSGGDLEVALKADRAVAARKGVKSFDELRNARPDKARTSDDAINRPLANPSLKFFDDAGRVTAQIPLGRALERLPRSTSVAEREESARVLNEAYVSSDNKIAAVVTQVIGSDAAAPEALLLRVLDARAGGRMIYTARLEPGRHPESVQVGTNGTVALTTVLEGDAGMSDAATHVFDPQGREVIAIPGAMANYAPTQQPVLAPNGRYFAAAVVSRERSARKTLLEMYDIATRVGCRSETVSYPSVALDSGVVIASGLGKEYRVSIPSE